jgi:hypothetical protein
MADEEAALRAIRAIAGAQSEFIGRERRYARSVEELFDALYLPAEADWSDSGYDVWISLSAAADNYRATVTAPDGTGLRSFFVDGTGVIRWARGEEATADDTVLEDPAAAPATDPDAGAPVVSPQ